MRFYVTAEDVKNSRPIVRQTVNLSPLIQRFADLSITVQREFKIGGVWLNLIGSILFVGMDDVADFNVLSPELRQEFEQQVIVAVRDAMDVQIQDPEYREYRMKFLRNVLDPQSPVPE